jgi:hypothetical protein
MGTNVYFELNIFPLLKVLAIVIDFKLWQYEVWSQRKKMVMIFSFSDNI